MCKSYTSAFSLLDYLGSQVQKVSNSSLPGGGSLNYSSGPSSNASVPNSFLVCLQEPPTNRHKQVSGLGNGNHLLFQAGGDRPRSAIFASANLSLWKLPNFTDEDVVTALWNTGNSNIPEIVVCSVYLDSNAQETVHPLLFRVARFCERKRFPLLFLGDLNAHSAFWRSYKEDNRGADLEEFILEYNLSVLNKGRDFTFFSGTSRSIIDVSLCSTGLEDFIMNWRVLDAVQGPDHRMCTFDITMSIPNRLSRNLRKGDWSLFRQVLERRGQGVPSEWSVTHLALEAQNFTSDVTAALDASCPKRPVSTRLRTFTGWTDELARLRGQVRHRFSYYRARRTAEAFDSLKAARRAFSKALRRARRKSWQEFCEGIDDFKKASLLNKVVQAKGRQSLGILKKEDGVSCDSPQETLDLLVKTHFPGNVDVTRTPPSRPPGPDDEVSTERCDVSDRGPASFISKDTVTEAICSFGDFKAPGPDGIQPLVLKKIGPEATKRLVAIYRASYLLGHVPKEWLQSNVVFMPKQGKDDYSSPRAFRPISLSSFLLKGLERVVYWHLSETALVERPLSIHQHAFRQERSCETALSFMTSQIESAFTAKGFALGVYLDIQGAFDNVSTESIVDGMRAKNFPTVTIKWYSYYLSHRTMVTEHQNISIEKRLTRGTPQGGVLSPLMWNLAFESLLEQFQRGEVKICGFADDAALIITGKNPAILQARMQAAIDKAVSWGRTRTLSFSPAKTQSILFTWKRKYTPPRPLTMNGTEIPYSDEVKYLGIWLDSKLTYSSHIKRKIRAAKGHLLNLQNAMGRLWGTTPKMTRWLYTSVVRPALTYGAVVWAKGTRSQNFEKQLTRVNRLALVTMGHFRRGTPTAGLEVIMNIWPLPLYIQYAAVSGYNRIYNLCKSQPDQLPSTWCYEVVQSPVAGLRVNRQTHHLDYCRDLLETVGHRVSTSDRLSNHFQWKKWYEVDKSSFQWGNPGDQNGIHVYTDGSRLHDSTGCGGVIYRDGQSIHSFSLHLGFPFTVFQGEVYAIFQAAQWISRNVDNSRVDFHVDARAALNTLAKFRQNSKLVRDTSLILNEAGTTNRVVLNWVKAHAGHLGNEQADALAKDGARDPFRVPAFMPCPPESYYKAQLKRKFSDFWDEQWQRLPTCRQTKQWFPHVSPRHSFDLLRSTRRELSELVQLITGHNFLKRHQALIDKTDDNKCRLCDEGSEETSFHVMAECPVLAVIRLQIFGAPTLELPLSWSKSQLVGFLREASIDLLSLDVDEAE